jgi:hypothetical protein
VGDNAEAVQRRSCALVSLAMTGLRNRKVPCMSPELVLQSVLAFLDDFISRGADEDLHDLRHRLSTDEETRRALVDQLPSGQPDDVKRSLRSSASWRASETSAGIRCAAAPPASWT